MAILGTYKSKIGRYYPFFIIPIISLYIFINIFDGNNGLLAHKYLDYEINLLEQQIASLQSDNSLLEIKINSLKSSDTNTDLIDEHVRSVLGYGKANEFTLYFQ